jgi:hypothetical protein
VRFIGAGLEHFVPERNALYRRSGVISLARLTGWRQLESDAFSWRGINEFLIRISFV